MGTAAGAADFFDDGIAARTGGVLFTEYLELTSVIAFVSFGV